MALQKEFESPTFRLGGGRSIRLSYWSIFTATLYPKTGQVSRVAFQYLDCSQGGDHMV